jgi:hypothetical protein
MEQYIRDANNLYGYTSERKLLADDELLPWYLIKPDAVWRLSWDVMCLCMVVLFAATVPVGRSVAAAEMVADADITGCC